MSGVHTVLSLAAGEEFRDRIWLMLCFSVVGGAGRGLGLFAAQIFTTSSAKEGAAVAGRSELPSRGGKPRLALSWVGAVDRLLLCSGSGSGQPSGQPPLDLHSLAFSVYTSHSLRAPGCPQAAVNLCGQDGVRPFSLGLQLSGHWRDWLGAAG